MDFFDKENISKIRLRSFYQTLTTDKEIYSEGAFQVVFQNNGEDVVTLEDVDGNKWVLQAGFPFEFNAHILTGIPGIVRDDIIKVSFAGAGGVQSLQIRFDRYVNKGDTQKYPGQ